MVMLVMSETLRSPVHDDALNDEAVHQTMVFLGSSEHPRNQPRSLPALWLFHTSVLWYI